MVKAPKFCHVTPILKFYMAYRPNQYECLEHKLLSLTYKAVTSSTYLSAVHSLISVQPLVVLAPHLLSPSLDHLYLLL